ncbi:T9SS type A sorting domain-containing protein, partial [bacterium]|nr:T9SS type A sorting domain-containing protein [bacterium]
QVGEEESVSVLFDLTGDHRLEGMVWSAEAADVVDWVIHVRSVIWYWWTEENELSLPVDSRQEFAVFPFNPDSDSLSFRWYLNDEQLEFDITEDVITVDFPDVGNHSLVSIVHDGCGVDTVTWEIDVYDPNRTAFDNLDPLPDCISLFDPRPNPFNATTTISYQLPEPGEVSIMIYDIRGRLVTMLTEGKTNAGFHSVVWDGSSVPSGIYLCHMRAVGYSRSVKMVLVR